MRLDSGHDAGRRLVTAPRFALAAKLAVKD